MNKEEFIEFLKTKQEEASGLNPSWCKIATNSDDYWKLNKPAVDWLEDDMDLSEDGIVKITYAKSLYGGKPKTFETSYDDFKDNYEKTIRR